MTRRRIYLLAGLVGLVLVGGLARASDLCEETGRWEVGAPRIPATAYEVAGLKVIEWCNARGQWCTAILDEGSRFAHPVALDCNDYSRCVPQTCQR